MALATGLALTPPLKAADASPPAAAQKLQPGQAIPSDELKSLVDGVVREAMARDHIAGVAVAVVQNGQVLFEKGYGFAGPAAVVDPDRTLFRVGSISKTFTWIAVMKEIEAGRMQLDGPINEYLPKDLTIPNVPGWRPIELRDLMSHTPGFEDRPLDHTFVTTPAGIWPLAKQLRLARPNRVFAPGTTPAYSNYGAMLAGEAVAHLEGASFQDVIEREITTPLGLAHTTFREPYPARADLPAPMSPELAADVATGYHWTGDSFAKERFEWLTHGAPAGSLSSTAGDMARYMLLMLGDGDLDGVRIYSPATALAFRTPIPVAEPDGGDIDHGFFQTPLPGGFVGYGHDGDTLWFHSNLVTIPVLGLGIFATTNTDTGPTLVHELPALIVGHFYAAPQEFPRSGSPELWAERAVYDGTYVTTRRPFTGLEKFIFQMLGQESIGITSGGYLVMHGVEGVQTSAPTGRAGHFQAIYGPDTTDFAIRGGRAVRWYPPGGASSFDRVGPLYQRSVLLVIVLLAGAAAIATLIGAAIRFRRASPATSGQHLLNGTQLLAAAAWLIALCAGALFASGAGNVAQLVYDWPGVPLLTASSAALAASLLSAAGLIGLPFVWTSDKGWGLWRKLRFTTTSVLFVVLGLQLAVWGLLEPWAT